MCPTRQRSPSGKQSAIRSRQSGTAVTVTAARPSPVLGLRSALKAELLALAERCRSARRSGGRPQRRRIHLALGAGASAG